MRDGKEFETVAVAIVGLGAIGRRAAELCAGDRVLRIVGLADPACAGDTVVGRTVEGSIADLAGCGATVAMLATGSVLADVADQIEALLEQGMHAVSTCEQLAYPAVHGAVAERLDAAARDAGRVVVGCGVNPGFLMDALPAMVATATNRPTAMHVLRRANLTRRRVQLREKIGVGLPVSAWDADRHGHYGLVESARLCARSVGWEAEDVAFSREALERDGMVTGVRELARLRTPEGHTVDLELWFEMDADELDSIAVTGEPCVRLDCIGGLEGDAATVARLLSTARCVAAVPPGLRLPIEVPAWSGV